MAGLEGLVVWVVGWVGVVVGLQPHWLEGRIWMGTVLIIKERPESVRISHDRMAPYLAPYGDSNVVKVARELDAKEEKLLNAAAE